MALTLKAPPDLSPYRERWNKALAEKTFVLVETTFPFQHPIARHVCGIPALPIGDDPASAEFLHIDIGRWQSTGVPMDWVRGVQFLGPDKPTITELHKRRIRWCVGLQEP